MWERRAKTVENGTPVSACPLMAGLLRWRTFGAKLRALDVEWSAAIHQLALGPVGDVLLAFPALVCGSMSLPLLLLSLLAVGETRLFLLGCPSTGCLLLLTHALKRRTGRSRPPPSTLPPRICNLRSLEAATHAMPSGDSAQAALWSTLLYSWSGGDARVLLLLPAVMFGRVYFRCHWVGDTMVGSVLGGLAGALVLSLSHLARAPLYSAS